MIIYRIDCDCGHHWWQEKVIDGMLYRCHKCNSLEGSYTQLDTIHDTHLITLDERDEIEQEFNIEIKN